MFGPFRKRIRSKRSAASAAGVAVESRPVGAGLYVDTENLQNSARFLIETTVEQWPPEIPALSRLNLYVRADRVALWDIWAGSRFPGLAVTVRGIQHFTSPHAKNSADIAIAIDAVADLVTGATRFVAVMSDDSDFMPVYAKLKDLGEGRVPFLWVMTDRTGTKASTIEDFFPNDHIQVVSVPETGAGSSVPSGGEGSAPALWHEMADLIIQEIPVGPFRSVECQPVIQSRWPDHPTAKMPGQQFGAEFAGKLWPILEGRRVKLLRTKPRKYEMTKEAKDGASPPGDTDR